MFNRLFFLPIAACTTAVLAVSTAYIVAVTRGDVYPWWPYISDTGTIVPERCIFGQLLTLTAILGLMIVYIRYKWIQSLPICDKSMARLNTAGLVIGVIFCIAMTFVANFQETSMGLVHLANSIVTYLTATAYGLLQSVITKRTCPAYGTACQWVLRLCFNLLGAITFLFVFSFGAVAYIKGRVWHGDDPTKILVWKPDNVGWEFHIVSTISEWLLVLSIIFNYLTFCQDFSRTRLNVTCEVAPNKVNDSDDATLLRQEQRSILH